MRKRLSVLLVGLLLVCTGCMPQEASVETPPSMTETAETVAPTATAQAAPTETAKPTATPTSKPTASPAASSPIIVAPTATAAPTETPATGVVVSSIDDLIANVAPGVTLLIPAKGLHLDSNTYYADSIDGMTSNPYVSFTDVYGGYAPVIQDVDGLTIISESDEIAPLTNNLESAYVLYFVNCTSLHIENVSAGHMVQWQCEGGVFFMKDCRDVTIHKTEMYGCGTEGLYLEDVVNLTMTDSVIYDCTYNLLTIFDCRNILFQNSTFRDTGFQSLVYAKTAYNVVFEDCLFIGNAAYSGMPFFNVFYDVDIVARRCDFQYNQVPMLTDNSIMRFFDCTFHRNDFDDKGEFYDDGIWLMYDTTDFD